MDDGSDRLLLGTADDGTAAVIFQGTLTANLGASFIP
jgi:hypothetical protein